MSGAGSAAVFIIIVAAIHAAPKVVTV